MKKLKIKNGLFPCPFCARQPSVGNFGKRIWTVFCKCGAESPRDSTSENGAKRIWNRRRFIILTN